MGWKGVKIKLNKANKGFFKEPENLFIWPSDFTRRKADNVQDP